MKGIDFDIADYRAGGTWCEAWILCPLKVREWCRRLVGGRLRSPLRWQQISHICRGNAGRQHYFANVLRLHHAPHKWADSHGRAGDVLLMVAKLRRGEHDFALWERLRTDCHSLGGWCQENKTVDGCDEWDIGHLRRELLEAVEKLDFGMGAEL